MQDPNRLSRDHVYNVRLDTRRNVYYVVMTNAEENDFWEISWDVWCETACEYNPKLMENHQ